MKILRQLKNIKNYDNKVAITKIKLFSYKLVIKTVKWYKLPDGQKI